VTDTTQALTDAVQRLSQKLAAQGAAALGFDLAADAALPAEGKAQGRAQHEIVDPGGAGEAKGHGRQDVLQSEGSSAVVTKAWHPPTGYVPRRDAQPAGLAAVSVAERDGEEGAATVSDEDTPFLKNAPSLKDERLVELLQTSGTASLASSTGQEEVLLGPEQRKSRGARVPAGAAEPAPSWAQEVKEDEAAAAVEAVWKSIKAAAMEAAKEALHVRQPHISSVVASLQQETDVPYDVEEEEITVSIWRDGLSYTNGAGHTPCLKLPLPPAFEADAPDPATEMPTSSGTITSASQLLREEDDPFARRTDGVRDAEEEIQEETRAVERVQVVVSEEEADDKMQDAEDKLSRMIRRAELMEKEARAIKRRSEEQAAALLLEAEQELIDAEMEAQRKKEEANKKIAAAEMLEEMARCREDALAKLERGGTGTVTRSRSKDNLLYNSYDRPGYY